MVQTLLTLLGLLLLGFPFSLIPKFRTKTAFVSLLSSVIVFNLALAIITQALHIFTYGVILTTHILVSLFIITKTNFRELARYIKEKIKKIDLVLI